MNIDNINVDTWYQNRLIKDHIPNHFTMTRTIVTSDNLEWVLEKLHGRFSLAQNVNNDEMDFMSYYQKSFAFEDPKEAVQFELTWS